MYKAVVTYNFSDDETRDSFTELLENWGFENQPDQSTYALDSRSTLSIEAIVREIIQWSTRNTINRKDCVQIYHPNIINIKATYLTSNVYKSELTRQD